MAGRKRSETSREAILVATFELVAEVGYAGLTVEGIAARAGVGKQTIYRWWQSKADVLFDALITKADLHIPSPDTGSFAGDLREFLTPTFRLAAGDRLARVLRSLMAQAQLDAEFGARFRAEFLRHRREALGVLVERAADRGDLPAGVRPETVVDLVFGVLWYRLLATDRAPDPALTDELVALFRIG